MSVIDKNKYHRIEIKSHLKDINRNLETLRLEVLEKDEYGNTEIYPMSGSSLIQMDCRVTECEFYVAGGDCSNLSPAITLIANGTFTCWTSKVFTKQERVKI